MANTWHWFSSDGSLPYRVAVGMAIFATLAIIDLRRNGSAATRWREYVFLVSCVACAMVYGIANDLITSRISPEYFLYFKGAAEHVSDEAAAHPEAHRGELNLQAMRIGALATWTAGLIAGALLLTANSIGGWPRLSLPRLVPSVILIFVFVAAAAVMCGIIGYNGGLEWTSADFREMVTRNEMRPYRLMATYGVHLGGYIGGAVGLLIAVAHVMQLRRRSPRLPA